MTDEELTAQLVEALWEWRGPETAISNAFLASRLLPVVRRYGDQRAAETEPAIGRVLALADKHAVCCQYVAIDDLRDTIAGGDQ